MDIGRIGPVHNCVWVLSGRCQPEGPLLNGNGGSSGNHVLTPCGATGTGNSTVG